MFRMKKAVAIAADKHAPTAKILFHLKYINKHIKAWSDRPSWLIHFFPVQSIKAQKMSDNTFRAVFQAASRAHAEFQFGENFSRPLSDRGPFVSRLALPLCLCLLRFHWNVKRERTAQTVHKKVSLLLLRFGFFIREIREPVCVWLNNSLRREDFPKLSLGLKQGQFYAKNLI